jgi:hypothetical protein
MASPPITVPCSGRWIAIFVWGFCGAILNFCACVFFLATLPGVSIADCGSVADLAQQLLCGSPCVCCVCGISHVHETLMAYF